MIFEPQKTVSAKVELVVEKSTGGRWRFELRLEATQPDVDGSVTIQAAPGQSALGPVMLYSPTDQPEPFTCHFTHDSSISFDVSPSEVRPVCHAACTGVCLMHVHLSPPHVIHTVSCYAYKTHWLSQCISLQLFSISFALCICALHYAFMLYTMLSCFTLKGCMHAHRGCCQSGQQQDRPPLKPPSR